ncbi:TlpA family protein disulfide reductase [Pedobacter sp. PAMC26386]|nr:TlpA family protein disulfide reductase [Pedobacter sp. PAMC26386]
MKRTLSSEIITPIIYHRVTKNDTIVNFVEFHMEKKVAGKQQPEFNLSYVQKPIFLLLNKKLPSFSLKDLDGNELSSAQLLGKPTLINFWSIYCGPCIEEMPQLSRLKEKYKDQMNFVSITENSAIDDDLKGFLKNKGFNFQVLENGEDYKGKLKIAALPTNLFLDKDGVVRYIQRNYPLTAQSTPLGIDDKDNYFVKIIDQLIKDVK